MAQGASADFSHHIGGMIIRRKNVGEILWAERPNKEPPLHRNPQSSIFDPRRLFPTVTPPSAGHFPFPARPRESAFARPKVWSQDCKSQELANPVRAAGRFLAAASPSRACKSPGRVDV